MSTKWQLMVTITCKTADREAANKLLESLGYGPNNINVQSKTNEWTTTLPWRDDELAELQQLADKHKGLEITVAGRKVARKAADAAMVKIKAKFDKAEYKGTNPATRAKARVTISTVAEARRVT